jgi:hypothetical protein
MPSDGGQPARLAELIAALSLAGRLGLGEADPAIAAACVRTLGRQGYACRAEARRHRAVGAGHAVGGESWGRPAITATMGAS